MTLILASASPRRRDLLSRLDLPFDVLPADVDERPPRPGEPPDAYALDLARTKALAVAARRPDDVVLGADTVVAVEDVFLAKPEDEADALRMLSLLRGRRHTVVTGVAVVCHQMLDDGSVSASVRMRDFTDEEMHRYVATGEPTDKAGAYAVQGLGGALVEGVDGCTNTVVGLPLCLTAKLLATCGIVVDLAPGLCCDAVQSAGSSAVR
jgi:septum formation protein